MNDRRERLTPPQTREIIGRARERQAVLEAILDTESCALHFLGEAGIGKTRQLREVALWNELQEAGRSPIEGRFEWLGLIDLYHSDLHTPSLVEEEIVRRIDPAFKSKREGSPFRDYLEKREEFEDRRRQGLVREKDRVEVTQTFVRDYNRWAVGRRAVIAFDTLELIFYEQDEVFQTGEGEEAGIADVKGWLLEVLPQFEHTAMLLASRPHERLESDFKKRFGRAEVCYEPLSLHELREEDALGYLEDIIEQQPKMRERLEEPDREPTDVYRDIWRYTQGVPVLMGLVIDLHAFGSHTLAKLRAMGDPLDEKKVREILIHELIEVQRDTLRCLAVARKGLTPELLQRLMGPENWTLTRCRQELDRLRGAVFTKSREDSEALFLHDAIYEMFDEFQPFPPAEGPGRLLPQIIKYYQEKIDDSQRALTERRARLRELELHEQAERTTLREQARRWELQQESAEWERRQQRLWVEMLFYSLWYDLPGGFELYSREYNEALKNRDFGYDARLHDEVLRFINSPLYEQSEDAQEQLSRDRFNRHCGLRWVKFHLARDDTRRAARVAQRLLEVSEPPLGGPEAQADLFYQAELRLWGAEALTYLGQETESESWLKEALDILEQTDASKPYTQWRRSRLIGRAHNDRAYIHWKSQCHRDGVHEYRIATAQFREAEILDELADTLKNLAYVYAVLGETTRAKGLMENARQLLEDTGKNHAIALAYNVTGEIHTQANEAEEAIEWCERARRIFADMEYVRGLGLAYIGLGRAYRKLGDKGKRGQYSFKNAQEAFQEAEGCLQKAFEIFGDGEPRVDEPLRRWEALNELGSTYTDWAYLLDWYHLPKEADEAFQMSVSFQKQAAQVADEMVKKDPSFGLRLLDSYDDLAYAYAAWGEQDEAERYLRKIDQAIPDAYRLVEGQGFQDMPNPVDGYWLVLGKYHLQRGVWARQAAEQGRTPQEKDHRLEESAYHFALALAYFQKFSPEQTYVFVISRTMYQHFKTLGTQRLERLRDEVMRVGEQYGVDMGRLLDTLDDTIGIPV